MHGQTVHTASFRSKLPNTQALPRNSCILDLYALWQLLHFATPACSKPAASLRPDEDICLRGPGGKSSGCMDTQITDI